MGDPVAAVAVYEEGLTIEPENDKQAILHANCAYALAMHGGEMASTRKHVQLALAKGITISPAALELLQTLSLLSEPLEKCWPTVFEQIGKAVESGDPDLWSDYLGHLQRWLSFVLNRGQGSSLLRWMDDKEYRMRYAPLYHALVAAMEGEDHLLHINPETRQPAERIYQGIAHRLKLYANIKRR
jgi:hypothetical protein